LKCFNCDAAVLSVHIALAGARANLVPKWGTANFSSQGQNRSTLNFMQMAYKNDSPVIEKVARRSAPPRI
jgi:hypothetical protein